MNRFWFPPLFLRSVFRLVASTSFLLTLSSQAVAQTPNDERLRIQRGNSLEPLLWSDAFPHSDRSFPALSLMEQWNPEALTSARLRYRVTSNLNANHLGVNHLSDSKTKSVTFGTHPRLIISPIALHTLQTVDESLEDNDNRSQFQQISAVLDERTDVEGAEHGHIGSTVLPATQASTPAMLEFTPDSGLAEYNPIADEFADIELSNINLTDIDPELGILRLRPLVGDGIATATSAAVIDPELGVLRLRAIPSSEESAAVGSESSVFLQGYLGFFNGNNLLARTEPLPDSTLQTGVTLRAVPRLGPRTFLVGTAGVSMLKYADHGEFNYSDLDFSLGLYHWVTRRTYVDVGWRNQQFFVEDGGDRFFNDHQLRVAVGRTDHLTPKLKLDSAYQLQSSWSDPRERSRLTNRFTLGLTHPVTSQLDASLSYQLALTNFTQQDRYDSYHQILAQLQFALSEEAKLTIFGGGRLGESTHSLIDFDSTLFGLSVVMNFALF